MNVDDPGTWLPLDGLRPGFDAGRAPRTDRLAGRELDIAIENGRRVIHRFSEDRVDWSAGNKDHGSGTYEAFAVAPGLYYAQIRNDREPRTARSLFADTALGRALEVVTTIGGPYGNGPACSQEFHVGVIEGGANAAGEPPAPSADLIGRRVLWVYSADHAYEHVYLSRHWYTWQCLAGPELGLADTDACTTYRLRAGIYVFTWREKVVPCAAVTVADHSAMRSHGALFGLDEAGTDAVHFTFGATGRLLGATVHPDRYDPRNIEV